MRNFFNRRVLIMLAFMFAVVMSTGLRAEQKEEKSAGEPQKLINLRKDYERTVEGVAIPIQDLYLKHLNKLLDRFTSQKKLDASLAVREEIRKIKGAQKRKGTILTVVDKSTTETAKTPTKSDFKKWLQEVEIYWGSGSSREITIQFDGSKMTVLVNGKRPASYKYNLVSPSAFEVYWGGEDNTFTLAEDKRSFLRVIKQSGNEYDAQVRKRSK